MVCKSGSHHVFNKITQTHIGKHLQPVNNVIRKPNKNRAIPIFIPRKTLCTYFTRDT